MGSGPVGTRFAKKGSPTEGAALALSSSLFPRVTI